MVVAYRLHFWMRHARTEVAVRLQKLRYLLIPALLVMMFAAWPQAVDAQRRGPVRGPVRQPRIVVRGGVYGPVYFDPWFSYGYGFGYGTPWYPYSYQMRYPAPYGYYGRYDVLTSAIRLEVTPRAAEVFVDGFAAGTVDSYDGFFQRLRLRPGEHELTLYLDGYRTVHQRVYVNSGSDQKIRYTMVPLPPGEQPEPRPQPPVAAAPEDVGAGFSRPDQPGARGMGPGRGGPPMRPQPGGPEQGRGPGPGPGQNAPFGSVSIRVQPNDADVLIDGERWTGPPNQERLTVQLSGGRHRVEIQKAGFERYANDVDVRPGETVTLNISLLRRD
jgi:hypothetical protein